MVTRRTTPPSSDVLLAANDKHAADIRDLPAEKLLSRLNFDVSTAVAIALGAHVAMEKLRAAIARLPAETTPHKLIESLDTIAHAVLFIYLGTLTAASEPNRLAQLTESARKLRSLLQADAVSAINHGYMKADAIADVPTGNGRLEIAQGLMGLGVAFRASWTDVQGHTPVTEKHLDDAAKLGVELFAALGVNDNPTASKNAQAGGDELLRAGSLLYYVYGQARRAVAYARWDEDDLNDFAPPFTGGRGPRPAKTGGDAVAVTPGTAGAGVAIAHGVGDAQGASGAKTGP